MLGRSWQYSEIPKSEEDSSGPTFIPEARPHWSLLLLRRWRNSALIVVLLILLTFLASEFRLVPKSYDALKTFSRPSPSEDGDRSKAIVIASFKAQDVSWLSLIPSDWQVFRYVTDDPSPSDGLAVPRDLGREAMPYLTYIIDNYDQLPQYSVFTHGHVQSWHQIEPLWAKLRALNLTALQEEDFVSLRCGIQMGCERQPFLDTENPNWSGEARVADYWNIIVPQQKAPRFLNYRCCAQFAVTRKAIRRRSLEDWKRIRAPLLDDESILYDQWSDEITNGWGKDWMMGSFYEKFWHVLFGADPEFCPSVQRCRLVYFSNAIVCDRDVDITAFEQVGTWNETKCVSAYDDVSPDEPVDLTEFHQNALELARMLRSDRAQLDREKADFWARERGREQEPPPPPPPPPPPMRA